MKSLTKRPEVTILTDPIPWGLDFIIENTRRIARYMRDQISLNRKYSNHPKYRGHFAVTRSLVEGLENIGASFTYNPRYLGQLAGTVIVLAGVRTLRQAIRLKKQGKIKKLFAGPNIVVFSSDYDSVIAAPEIDAVITPSDWVVKLYREDIGLKAKIFAWPAGVDTSYWRPSPESITKNVLIFDKRQVNDDPERIKPYADYLRSIGWQVNVLLRCGAQGYTSEQYRNLLQTSRLMLGFTVGNESQGLAWCEAWSCNVPTLILRNSLNVYRGRTFACSTAPYLTPQNGLFFDDLEDFKVQFAYWEAHREQFKPRAWTLENMSDKVCASMLYKKVIEC